MDETAGQGSPRGTDQGAPCEPPACPSSPPTCVIPVSSASISCVLRASLAEKSVGSAMACGVEGKVPGYGSGSTDRSSAGGMAPTPLNRTAHAKMPGRGAWASTGTGMSGWVRAWLGKEAAAGLLHQTSWCAGTACRPALPPWPAGRARGGGRPGQLGAGWDAPKQSGAQLFRSCSFGLKVCITAREFTTQTQVSLSCPVPPTSSACAPRGLPSPPAPPPSLPPGPPPQWCG